MPEPGSGLARRLPMIPPPTLSVIIPTWNEAPLIADAVRCAACIGDEVLVVDPGCPDGTGEIAREAGARLVGAPKGRGPQLLAGAAAATGDVLLFLHADARLGPGARAAILDALANPEVVGGAFYLRFLPQSWFTRLLEPANERRRRRSGRSYGDTGIFVRREVYAGLGGHKPWPLMHDFEFSGRLAAAGRCVYIADPPIWASARRFDGRELRVLAQWLSLRFLYLLGISPHVLARAYPDVRGGDPERFIALARERTGQPEGRDALIGERRGDQARSRVPK